MKPYYEDSKGIVLYLGDCLEVMPQIAPASIDAVICDPPYGTTACAWDTVIPFAPMWAAIKRLIRPRTPTVLFGQEPFSSALVMSNPKQFKYSWVWDKNNAAGYATVAYQPFIVTENICVFGSGGIKYYPQMVQRATPLRKGGMYRGSEHYSLKPIHKQEEYPFAYPKNLLYYSNASHTGKEHPTQKPLALMEYLVRTYTEKGDTILDFTCGSGTTLRAAKNLGRKAIGIEIREDYADITVNRLAPVFEAALVDTTEDYGPLFAHDT